MEREKKGVAGIIAGVFLAAILFSSVIIFFLSITEGQSTRSRAEVEAQSYKNKKLLETFKVRSRDNLTPTGHIEVQLNNTGAIPTTASYLVVYNATTSVPILQGEPLIGGNPFVVNGGLNAVVSTADVDDSITFVSNPSTDPSQFPSNPSVPYKIDIISERGNIETTTYPPPPLIDINLEVTVGENLAEAVFAQQTGSIVLNYTGFGAIYPNFGTSGDGVDQRGWSATINDVPGYPAFRLIDDEKPTYLTSRVKNKDFGEENMYLTHHTAYVLTNDFGGSFSQDAIYLCETNYTTGEVFQYDDNNPITLINEFKQPSPVPWKNLTFCDINIAAAKDPQDFDPDFKAVSSNVNFLFMIVRATFADGKPYAQTIPYQAVLIPKDRFTVTLSNHIGAAGSPVTVTAGAAPPTSPWDVHWIYQDNTYTSLGSTSGTSLPVNVPTKMPDPDPDNDLCEVYLDPNDLDCPDIVPGFYIIQISDADERVYFRTFEVI
ncbi:MAG: hypothetical protein ACE5J2_07555 [Nitrososphaerales archaeon]